MTEMVEEKRVGRQVLRFEEEDLLVIEIQGNFAQEEASVMFRLHDERLLAKGYLLVVVDVTAATGMSRTATHESRNRPKNLPPHAVAVVGASFSLRVVMDIIARATRLLSSSKVTMGFFDDQPAARAWLREMRPKFAGQSSR